MNLSQPQIIVISKQYEELKQQINPFSQYQNLNHSLVNYLQFDNLADVAQILIKYNVMDLDIWKQLLFEINSNIERFTLNQLEIIFTALGRFVLTKFRHEKPKSFDLYFNENGLLQLISRADVESLVQKIHYTAEFADQYMNIIRSLMDIYTKLSRITNVNYFLFNQILIQNTQPILERVSELSLMNLVTLYEIQEENESIIQAIIAKINGKQLDWKLLDRILDIWKFRGCYHKSLFDCLKGQIKDCITDDNSISQSRKLQRIFSLILSKVEDEELIKLICKKLIIPEEIIKRMPNNMQNTYYISLRLLNIRYPALKIEPKAKLQPMNLNPIREKSKQERILINYVHQYIEKLNEEVTLSVDETVWLYIVDMALYFKDCKVALEMSGFNYLRQNTLTGKKSAKREILIAEKWIPLFLSSTEKVIFESFSFSQDTMPHKVECLFDELFELAIGRKLIKKKL